jgi:heme/copper-type cytochrome/quinol oxidase subunit 2
MPAMRHGPSNLIGAIAAWLCLAPVAFASVSLSMPSTLAPASAPTHYVASLSLFLTWIAGGLFLVVGGLLAVVPFGFRARKLDPLPVPVQVYRSAGIDLAWTVIPVLVLVLFLA